MKQLDYNGHLQVKNSVFFEPGDCAAIKHLLPAVRQASHDLSRLGTCIPQLYAAKYFRAIRFGKKGRNMAAQV